MTGTRSVVPSAATSSIVEPVRVGSGAIERSSPGPAPPPDAPASAGTAAPVPSATASIDPSSAASPVERRNRSMSAPERNTIRPDESSTTVWRIGAPAATPSVPWTFATSSGEMPFAPAATM